MDAVKCFGLKVLGRARFLGEDWVLYEDEQFAAAIHADHFDEVDRDFRPARYELYSTEEDLNAPDRYGAYDCAESTFVGIPYRAKADAEALVAELNAEHERERYTRWCRRMDTTYAAFANEAQLAAILKALGIEGVNTAGGWVAALEA
jgi:hypothetical protein